MKFANPIDNRGQGGDSERRGGKDKGKQPGKGKGKSKGKSKGKPKGKGKDKSKKEDAKQKESRAPGGGGREGEEKLDDVGAAMTSWTGGKPFVKWDLWKVSTS